MESVGVSLFETFEVDSSIEPVNPTRVAKVPLRGAVTAGDLPDYCRHNADGYDAELVDLGGISLVDALAANEESIRHSMARLLANIDDADGSFGGYNPNQTENL
jgi:hypothetical protein